MRILVPIFIVGLSLTAGCGDPVASSPESTPAALTSAASFWLPSLKATRVESHHGKAPCQFQLDVELSVSGERFTGVMLADEVEGACDSLILENKRFYELRMVAVECGSRIYEGWLPAARGRSRLRVIDHSQQRCGVPTTSTLEIEEQHAHSKVQRYAGAWQ